MFPTATSDIELLRRCRAGHAAAFGALVERHRAVVCAAAYRATGDAALGEDLAQEAFVTAWRRLDELRDPSRFASWVCGIARNLARSDRRHAQRHAPGTHACHPSRGPDAGRSRDRLDALIVDLPCPRPSPLDEAIARQRRELLDRALADVPSAYREPLVLFYRDQRSVDQVADALDLSHATVKQRLCRGRRHLRSGIERLVAAARRDGASVESGLAVAVVVAISLAGTPAWASPAGPAAVSGSLGALARPIFGLGCTAAALAAAALVVVSSDRSLPDGPSPSSSRPSVVRVVAVDEIVAVDRPSPTPRGTVEMGPVETGTAVTTGAAVTTAVRAAPRRSPHRIAPRSAVARAGFPSRPPQPELAEPPTGTVEMGQPIIDRLPDRGRPLTLGEVVDDRSLRDDLVAAGDPVRRRLPVDPPDLRARILDVDP